jgi:hypothetical protein
VIVVVMFLAYLDALARQGKGKETLSFSFRSLSLSCFIWSRRSKAMASKRAKANHKGKGQEPYPPGTKHEQVHPSLATLTRLPLQDIPVGAIPEKVASGQRREFILALLQAAGGQGLTWGEIRADLIKVYGSAPVKRAALYSILAGVQYHKTTGPKGVVTYHLGRAPRRSKVKG